jgi:hypothetical protein
MDLRPENRHAWLRKISPRLSNIEDQIEQNIENRLQAIEHRFRATKHRIGQLAIFYQPDRNELLVNNPESFTITSGSQ